MATGRAPETKSSESERKQEHQREYQTLISDLESLRKNFEKLQKGDGESPGFDVLKESFSDMRFVPSAFNIKEEWTDLLNKMRDSEKHEYNVYELNLHWIIQNDRKNLDELVTGLNHTNAEAGSIESTDHGFNLFIKVSRYIEVCVMASRLIDEVSRFITKVENHTFKPDTALSAGQALLIGGYISMAMLISITPLQDWRPPIGEKEEMDMLKTYLKDLTERLEKIRHSVGTNLDSAKKESAEYKKKIREEVTFLFSKEKKQKDSVSPPAEEKKKESSYRP